MYPCNCRQSKNNKNVFLVDSRCHPQSIAVVVTRAEHLGVEVMVQDYRDFDFTDDVCGVLLQYPNTDGQINDYSETIDMAHQNKVKTVARIIFFAILWLSYCPGNGCFWLVNLNRK